MALNVASVRQEMKKLGIVPIRADFTGPDETISKWLKRYQKAGVPMYVVVPADPSQAMFTLPEVLTPGMVIDALRRAAEAPESSSTGD